MSLQQKNTLDKIAHKANSKAKRYSHIPIVKFKVSKVTVGDDYSLKIDYKGYLKTHKLYKKFVKIYSMQTKKNFCKNNFYNRMINGLKMHFHYFDQNHKLITSFHLDQDICYQHNKDLNRILNTKL